MPRPTHGTVTPPRGCLGLQGRALPVSFPQNALFTYSKCQPAAPRLSKFGSQTIYLLDDWNRVNSFSLAEMTGWVSRDGCVAPRGENILGVSIFGRIEWCGKCEALETSLRQRFSRVAKLRDSREGLAKEEAGDDGRRLPCSRLSPCKKQMTNPVS